MEPLGEVVIRTASNQDAAAIAAVHVRSWQEAYAGIVPSTHLAGLDPAQRAAEWTDELRRADEEQLRVWVAEQDAEVVGFVAVGPSRDEDARRGELEVRSMYLQPEQWGRGTARDLLRAALADAGEGTPLSLWVLADSERARHFYRRHGFQPDGVERYEEVGGAELLCVRYRRG